MITMYPWKPKAKVGRVDIDLLLVGGSTLRQSMMCTTITILNSVRLPVYINHLKKQHLPMHVLVILYLKYYVMAMVIFRTQTIKPVIIASYGP